MNRNESERQYTDEQKNRERVNSFDNTYTHTRAQTLEYNENKTLEAQQWD